MNRKIKQNDHSMTCSYSKERLEKVKCIACTKEYQIKIVEHETKINSNVNKCETLHNIFCPECGMPHIRINFS